MTGKRPYRLGAGGLVVSAFVTGPSRNRNNRPLLCACRLHRPAHTYRHQTSTMFKLTSKLIATAAALLGTGLAVAQTNNALLDILVKKGIVTDTEAKQLKTELAKTEGRTDVATSGSKYLDKLVISGRFQVQYAGLGTAVDNQAANPASTEHFFLRRIYLGAKASLGNGWTGTLNYDFANSTFDAAFITWKMDDTLAVDVGFRKVPFGLEEWYTSSGNLKAIERTPSTRYFVESNNGRRLGAGSYRTGVFAGGKLTNGFFYNVAVTNPERDESSSLSGVSTATGGVQSSGSAANNNLSYWGNVGYTGKSQGWTYTGSASVGYLPDQGGLTLGKGDNITVYSVWGTLAKGPFELQAEYLSGTDQHGISATRDAKPSGFFLQPAYKINDQFEAVLRYDVLYAGRRGVNLSDGVRSAPGGGTMKSMTEWYYGFNYYIRGNDLKLQLGYVHAESKDTVTGAPASATTDGIRSQLQLNF